MNSLLFLSIIAMLLTGCGNGNTSRKPDLEGPTSIDVLADTGYGVISFTTSYTKGVIGIPVWQVYREENGEKKCLFTIERIWQEAEPGVPILSADMSSITDSQQSYIYSLSELRFLKNTNEHFVYEGKYQKE